MSPLSNLAPGDVVIVDFPAHSPGGREQEGARPAVVAGAAIGPLRFPLLMVVPLTTAGGAWQTMNPRTYPAIQAGSGGLPKLSVALTDQLRAVDRQRLRAYVGALTPVLYAPIHAAIAAALPPV